MNCNKVSHDTPCEVLRNYSWDLDLIRFLLRRLRCPYLRCAEEQYEKFDYILTFREREREREETEKTSQSMIFLIKKLHLRCNSTRS